MPSGIEPLSDFRVIGESEMSKCGYAGCEGHLGKFDSCLTEALWEMSLDGLYGDGQTGDAQFEGHLTLFVFSEPETHHFEDGRIIDVPAGNYIVETVNSGAVYLADYATEAEAREVFERAEARYSEWLDQED